MHTLLIELQRELVSWLDVEDCTALICVSTGWQAIVNSRPVLLGLKARYNLQLPTLESDENGFSILLKDYDKRYLTRRCYRYRSKVDCLLYAIKNCPEEKLDFKELTTVLKTCREESLIYYQLTKHGFYQTIARAIKCREEEIAMRFLFQNAMIAGTVKCKNETAKQLILGLIDDRLSLAEAQVCEDAFYGRWTILTRYVKSEKFAIAILRGFARAGNVQFFLRFIAFFYELNYEQVTKQELLEKLFVNIASGNFIFQAIKSNCLEMVLLMEKFYNNSPLFYACSSAVKQGNLTIFQLIFKKYRKQESKQNVVEYVNSSIIVEAIKSGATEIINYLLKKDYINHQRALRTAIAEGRLDYIKLFIEHTKTSQAVFEGYPKKTNLFDAEMQKLMLESRFPELLPYIKT